MIKEKTLIYIAKIRVFNAIMYVYNLYNLGTRSIAYSHVFQCCGIIIKINELDFFRCALRNIVHYQIHIRVCLGYLFYLDMNLHQ